MPAGVTISVEVIKLYCRKLGIDRRQLLEQSKLEERTLRRVMRRGRGSQNTAEHIAGALGISVVELRMGIAPTVVPERPKLKSRYECSVHLDIPHAEMADLKVQHEKRALLEKVIGATSNIKPLRVEDGSTILHLFLTDADILRLLAAMMDNELEILRIKRVAIPDPSWLIIMLALLNYNNKELVRQLKLTPLSDQAQPQVIKPEALSLLLTNHVLEQDMRMKTRDCIMCKRID
jgi:transcriptional regulator with XRE-family HTH domain